jgi:hypothetical protein
MKNKNSNKEMAELFYNLYVGCLKFKLQKEQKKSDKIINCHEYYDKFQFFAEKYIDDKEQRN